jgi:hypothetical protein
MNVSIERLEQIEQERQETMINPAFQEWMRLLNVSQSYSTPEPILNARDMMKLWVNKHGELNSFSLILK